MKITIKTVKDVEKLLKSGKTPLQVSLKHWKENLGLMEENDFNSVNFGSDICALCVDDDDGSGSCKNCLLKIAGHKCGAPNSFWGKISAGIEDIERIISGYYPKYKGKLATETKVYDLKNNILSHTKNLISTLEELRKVEKQKPVMKIKILVNKGTHREWIEIDNVICIENFKSEEIWPIGSEFSSFNCLDEKVSSFTEDKEYEITWKEDKLTGDYFDARCSCPAFIYKTRRPCKHIVHIGLEDAYDGEVIAKSRRLT